MAEGPYPPRLPELRAFREKQPIPSITPKRIPFSVPCGYQFRRLLLATATARKVRGRSKPILLPWATWGIRLHYLELRRHHVLISHIGRVFDTEGLMVYSELCGTVCRIIMQQLGECRPLKNHRCVCKKGRIFSVSTASSASV